MTCPCVSRPVALEIGPAAKLGCQAVSVQPQDAGQAHQELKMFLYIYKPLLPVYMLHVREIPCPNGGGEEREQVIMRLEHHLVTCRNREKNSLVYKLIYLAVSLPFFVQ